MSLGRKRPLKIKDMWMDGVDAKDVADTIAVPPDPDIAARSAPRDGSKRELNCSVQSARYRESRPLRLDDGSQIKLTKRRSSRSSFL